ncbi:MAG: hypothetical protein DRZ80_04950 [Thermoprotei archaeon]|nr:MAG: hypothetical protein DRZ80_04950 [Thermoprotei archaeon]
MQVNCYERVLISLYALNSKKNRVTRRQLSTYVFIADTVAGFSLPHTIELFPDGVEYSLANLSIDLLSSLGYLTIVNGLLEISINGAKRVEEILTNPDYKQARIYYRLISRLTNLDFDKVMTIASYFLAQKSGISDAEFPREIRDLVNDLMSILKTFRREELLVEKVKDEVT